MRLAFRVQMDATRGARISRCRVEVGHASRLDDVVVKPCVDQPEFRLVERVEDGRAVMLHGIHDFVSDPRDKVPDNELAHGTGAGKVGRAALQTRKYQRTIEVVEHLLFVEAVAKRMPGASRQVVDGPQFVWFRGRAVQGGRHGGQKVVGVQKDSNPDGPGWGAPLCSAQQLLIALAEGVSKAPVGNRNRTAGVSRVFEERPAAGVVAVRPAVALYRMTPLACDCSQPTTLRAATTSGTACLTDVASQI